jgi:hypothetical protein
VRFSQQTATVSPNSIDRLGFLMETSCNELLHGSTQYDDTRARNLEGSGAAVGEPLRPRRSTEAPRPGAVVFSVRCEPLHELRTGTREFPFQCSALRLFPCRPWKRSAALVAFADANAGGGGLPVAKGFVACCGFRLEGELSGPRVQWLPRFDYNDKGRPGPTAALPASVEKRGYKTIHSDRGARDTDVRRQTFLNCH